MTHRWSLAKITTNSICESQVKNVINHSQLWCRALWFYFLDNYINRGRFKVRRTPVCATKNCLKCSLSKKIITALLSCLVVCRTSRSTSDQSLYISHDCDIGKIFNDIPFMLILCICVQIKGEIDIFNIFFWFTKKKREINQSINHVIWPTFVKSDWMINYIRDNCDKSGRWNLNDFVLIG